MQATQRCVTGNMVEWGCLISLYTWPSTNLTAGSSPGTPISWCCPSPPVVQLESSQCPQTFITLTRLSSLGTERCQMGLERKDLSTMALTCRSLNTETQFCFRLCQWTGNKFFSDLLHVEILVKLCRPKMLSTPLIMSSWMTWCTLSRFSPVHLTWNLKTENLHPQFGCFWNVNTIQRLCSTQHIITMTCCF